MLLANPVSFSTTHICEYCSNALIFFIALVGENVGKESNEDVIRFLLQKIQYCLDMGLICADQMKREMSEGTKKDSSISGFREYVLKPKLFMEGTSDSLKTQLATYMINFNYPREPGNWTQMFESGVITNNSGETYTLNKLQRYNCVMKLAKWGHEYEAFFDQEFAKEYSDADEHAKMRI